jgi:hypothetical protein
MRIATIEIGINKAIFCFIILAKIGSRHCVQRVRLCAGRNSCSTAWLDRNFPVHGQNTTARAEIQLLNIPILSPGWRKAHVVRGAL